MQDAVDLEDATEAEAAELKAWKKYRIALIRVPDRPGYPAPSTGRASRLTSSIAGNRLA
ncbi:tail fiber assembly protein [Pseudomonas sp. DG56-2]|uniref:tail fiber assembly protein n=1 Tax=Pseudomonas sp. DG56-2 TaxID=2320270 RepID=UPI0035322460